MVTGVVKQFNIANRRSPEGRGSSLQVTGSSSGIDTSFSSAKLQVVRMVLLVVDVKLVV